MVAAFGGYCGFGESEGHLKEKRVWCLDTIADYKCRMVCKQMSIKMESERINAI